MVTLYIENSLKEESPPQIKSQTLITDPHKEDWQLLIVLDACRLDTFQKVNIIPGELVVFKSVSTTAQFLSRFFCNGVHPNLIYLTANPYLTANKKHHFKDLWCVWDWGWDWIYHTVHPAVMCAEMQRAIIEYPYCRIVAHFMQPHHPFIGEYRIKGHETDSFSIGFEPPDRPIWSYVRDGSIAVEEAIKAYESNLELVLTYLYWTLKPHYTKRLPEKIVITADHGNLLGEHGKYGHPGNADVPQLTHVPWLKVLMDSEKW